LIAKILYLAKEPMYAVKVRDARNAALPFAKNLPKRLAFGFGNERVGLQTLFSAMHEAGGLAVMESSTYCANI
jgi:hypothetical protein